MQPDDVLSEICAKKWDHISAQRAKVTEEQLRERITELPPTRGFKKALAATYRDGRIPLIAEIKRSSPSKGVIRAGFEPSRIAKAYEEGGASCLSVVTDTPYFQGADEHLRAARAAVELPILRKDFILDPYQVLESRALGADAILLIVAALTYQELRDLEALAMELGMDVLVEVHAEDELEIARRLKTTLLGINSRNLKSLQVDLNHFATVARRVPNDYVLVAESGISNHKDILALKGHGAKAFLVGTALMRQPDIKDATLKMLGY